MGYPSPPGQPQYGQPPVQPPVGYPPQYGGGYPPPAPAKSNTTRNILLIVGLVLLLGIGGCVALVFAAGNSVDNAVDRAVTDFQDNYGTAPDDAFDLKLNDDDGCTTDDFGYPEVNGTIENTSGKSHGFNITVSVDDNDGNRIGDTFNVFIDPIDDGKSAVFSGSGFTEVTSEFTCKIDDVSFNG